MTSPPSRLRSSAVGISVQHRLPTHHHRRRHRAQRRYCYPAAGVCVVGRNGYWSLERLEVLQAGCLGHAHDQASDQL